MQNIRGKEVPENLEEAMEEIRKLIMKSKEGLFTEFVGWSEEKATTYFHHTLGRYLRNNWGFWGKSKLKSWMEQQGFTHADDMSTALILFTHRNENGVPLKIQEEVSKYKAYWDNMSELAPGE